MNFINKNEKNNKNLYIWCVCVHVCVCVWVCVRVSVRVCVRVVCVHVFAFKIDVKVFQKQSWQIKPSSSKMQFSSPQRSWNHAGTKVITAHPVLSGLWVTGVAVEGMITLLFFSCFWEDWFSTRSVVCASDISTDTSLQSGSWDIPSSRKKAYICL